MTEYKRKYDRVFNSISRLDLQKGALGLEELGIEDLFASEPELWLGFYTKEGLETAFKKYGFIEDFKEQGFEEVDFELIFNDAEEHMLRFWGKKPECPDIPLIELVVRRGHIKPSGALASRLKRNYLNVLDVEWLQMQNPLAQFDASRPPLPGQNFPGLGLGKQVMELLRQASKRLQLDGLLTTPSYFHNALFYSEEFYFFDPEVQGLFLALCRDILPQARNVGFASWALNWKMVAQMNPDGEPEPFAWFHESQVCPVSNELEKYFKSELYARDSLQALSTHQFKVLVTNLRETLEKKGLAPFDLEKLGWVTQP